MFSDGRLRRVSRSRDRVTPVPVNLSASGYFTALPTSRGSVSGPPSPCPHSDFSTAPCRVNPVPAAGNPLFVGCDERNLPLQAAVSIGLLPPEIAPGRICYSGRLFIGGSFSPRNTLSQLSWASLCPDIPRTIRSPAAALFTATTYRGRIGRSGPGVRLRVFTAAGVTCRDARSCRLFQVPVGVARVQEPDLASHVGELPRLHGTRRSAANGCPGVVADPVVVRQRSDPLRSGFVPICPGRLDESRFAIRIPSMPFADSCCRATELCRLRGLPRLPPALPAPTAKTNPSAFWIPLVS